MDETIEKSRAYTDAVIKRIDREMPVELKRFEAGITRTVMKVRGTPLDKLGELYRCIDKVFDFFGKYTPCKQGARTSVRMRLISPEMTSVCPDSLAVAHSAETARSLA